MRDVPDWMDAAFYAQQRSERVPLVINDTVEIVSGPNAGAEAAVISIVAIRPNLSFVVELLETGHDVTCSIDELLRRHAD